MALTERYVTTTGAGAHDGTNEANAFSWTEMITDINTPRAGYRYNVKQGTYSLGASSTITGDGSTTTPNVIRGYKTTIGDATLGRTTGGTLDQSNMPTIAFASTFRFIANTGTQLIVESLKITSTVANGTILVGLDSVVLNCVIENTSTSAAAIGINTSTATASAIGNDVTLANGVSGSIGILTTGVCVYNRIKNAGGTGISAEATAKPCAHNTIFESGIGIATTSATVTHCLLNNTIVNCSGDGINILTSTTGIQTIIGNHITGSGGYGINFNTSTCPKLLINNRFRDNTSGNINGDGDWGLGTNQLNITSDDTDALDFTDQSTDDYSLKSSAAGARRGLSYLTNIGAEGTPASSGGGGPLIDGRLVR